MSPVEVFLSHTSQDGDDVDRVADLLQRHGVPYFYSPRDIVPAQQWHDEASRALLRIWGIGLKSE